MSHLSFGVHIIWGGGTQTGAQENVYLLRAVWLTINQQRTIILILSVFQTKRKDHLYRAVLGCTGLAVTFHFICLSGVQSLAGVVSVMLSV